MGGIVPQLVAYINALQMALVMQVGENRALVGVVNQQTELLNKSTAAINRLLLSMKETNDNGC